MSHSGRPASASGYNAQGQTRRASRTSSKGYVGGSLTGKAHSHHRPAGSASSLSSHALNLGPEAEMKKKMYDHKSHRSATASSLKSSMVGVPATKDAFEEKVRGPRYNPPDDSFAGTSSNRLDQRDRGLRTKIDGNQSGFANISLQWVADPEGAYSHRDKFAAVDPGNIPHSAGITSDNPNMTQRETGGGGVASRGRMPNMLKEKQKQGPRGDHLKSTDPITHSFDEEKPRRRKGEAKALFMENREDYNIFKKKNMNDLSEQEKKVLNQRRILAVDNHKATYRIAGDQDLLPGGTKEFSKADKPVSSTLHRFNDKRLLAGFELDRISKRRHPVVRTNMESRDLRHSIYWVGREDERKAMSARGMFSKYEDAEEGNHRPQSAPNFLAHNLGGRSDEEAEIIKAGRHKRLKARDQDNRVQKLYYELIRSTRPHMHHDLGTGELVGGQLDR